MASYLALEMTRAVLVQGGVSCCTAAAPRVQRVAAHRQLWARGSFQATGSG